MNIYSAKRLEFGPASWCLITLALLGSAHPSLAAPAALDDIRRDATVRAIETVMPSVVNIATKQVVPVRDPFEQFYRQLRHLRPYDEYFSLGSGVVIDESGYLLTNDHVVRRADQIAVRFGTGTNEYQATVVASDPAADVALLKLNSRPGERFHAIRMAPEDDLLLGETVLALGDPLGSGGSVITRGILSSKSRSAPSEGQPSDYNNWLQIDAPINPGNSGGPLVNLRGELIGINVAVVREANGIPVEGIGFAIPIRLILKALSDIFPTDFVKSYWFGARVKIGTAPLAIDTVAPDSPAGRAGLLPGDRILQVNGIPPRSFIDFANLLGASGRADVVLAVQRGAEQRKIAVKLVPENHVFNAQFIRSKLGLDLQQLSSREVAVRFRQLNSPGAILISGVEDGSPAAAANLQSGMLILGLSDEPVFDITALAKRIYTKQPGQSVDLVLGAWQRMGERHLFFQFARAVTLR